MTGTPLSRLPSTPARPGAAPEPSLQRGHAIRLDDTSHPAEVASRTGLVAHATALSDTGEVSVEFAPPPGWAAGAEAGGPMVSRQVESAAGASNTPPVPPSAPADHTTLPELAASAMATEVPGGPSADQLERLGKDLYEKVREELRRELRLDRDRAGLLTRLAR